MATIVTDLYRALTFEEALQIASTSSGVLTRHFTLQWGRNREHDYVLSGAWAGAYLDNGVARYLDGTPIPIEKLRGNLDDGDPTNDYDRIAIQERGLSDIPPYIVVTQLAIDLDAAVNYGTQYDDALYTWLDPEIGSPAGKVFNLLGGNDFVYDDRDSSAAAVTYNVGAGNDYLEVRGRTKVTAIDGAGSDIVEIETGVIKASLDGDNDTFFAGGFSTLSYENAKQDLVMLGDGKVRSLEVGVDSIEGYQLIGGSGNDTLMNFSRITGGRGNDNITPWSYGSGGDGNDTLIAGESPSGKVTLLGDAGADTFIFRAGVAEATGGAGVDRFVFEAVMPVKINDLQAGEVIDLTALLDVSVSDAFAGGYLKQTVLKGYTYLSIDLDGGGNDYQDLATVKGVFGLADYILA